MNITANREAELIACSALKGFMLKSKKPNKQQNTEETSKQYVKLHTTQTEWARRQESVVLDPNHDKQQNIQLLI